MADTATYENSSLDRDALSELARRAAEETTLKPDPRIVYYDREAQKNVEVLGRHWVLAQLRDRHENFVNDYVYEEGYYHQIYALLPDGKLMLVSISDEERITKHGVQLTGTNTHHVGPMSDTDIESFDFKRKYHEVRTGPENNFWGDCDRPGDRGDLLHDTKGAGLVELLEAVRTGHAELPHASNFHTPTTPPPTTPSPAESRQTAGTGQRQAQTKERSQATTFPRTIRKVLWPLALAMVFLGIIGPTGLLWIGLVFAVAAFLLGKV